MDEDDEYSSIHYGDEAYVAGTELVEGHYQADYEFGQW